MSSKLIICNCVGILIYSVTYLGGNWCPRLRLCFCVGGHRCPSGLGGAGAPQAFPRCCSSAVMQAGDGKGLLAVTEGQDDQYKPISE